MMNDYQRAVFEQMSAGMSATEKASLRAELERRIRQASEESTKLATAQYWAQRTQQEINIQPRRKHAVIVAVDLLGGFSKDGKIPWHHKEDFDWFKSHTEGHICVMGRATYEDINSRRPNKEGVSVLPNRMCFVVSSTDLPVLNATRISSIGELDTHLYDVDVNKTVFYIGGERIYREGIAKADMAYVTVVNAEVDADKFFPTKYLTSHFNPQRNQRADGVPNLRFTTWIRK